MNGGPGAAGLLSVTEAGHTRAESLLVSRLLDSQAVIQRAPGPLSPAQETAAVAFSKSLYDVNSVRVIQVIVASMVDGRFGPVAAQAVATFQQARGIPASGQVD